MHIILHILHTFFYLIYCYLEAAMRLFVPLKKKSMVGKVVLVTGAGHGIGRELAIKFSDIGARLVLWDINKVHVCPNKMFNGNTGMLQKNLVQDLRLPHVVSIDFWQYKVEVEVEKQAGWGQVLGHHDKLVHTKH